MNELETRYRTLFAAYPMEYRLAREDEMVATLLEAAEPGQSRPTRREAVSLVMNGLGCRARSSVEFSAGIRIAGLIGLAAATQMVVFTALWHHQVGSSAPWQSLVVWTVALVGLVMSSVRRLGRWRFVLLATAPVVASGLLPTGGDLGETAAFYALAALGTCAVGTRWWARLCAVAIGAAWGWYTVAYSLDAMFDTYRVDFPAWASPYSWSLDNGALVVVICALGLVIGFIRQRFFYAAGAVATAVAVAQMCRSGAAWSVLAAAMLVVAFAIRLRMRRVAVA